MGGTKHDSNKPRMELLPPEALEAVARVMTFGATKYGDNQWRAGFSYGRLLGATLRHTFAFMRGEDSDPESGESHLAHATANLLFLLTQIHNNTGSDDRWKK